MAAADPIIVCGRTEQIGRTVIAALQPDYEVVHFILTPQSGVVQIPLLLQGEKKVPTDSELGSKNYSRVPVAVILGGGYDDVAVAEIMAAVTAAEGAKQVPWLRPDLKKPAPPVGPEYGKALVGRIKDTLRELKAEGKMYEGTIVWY